MSVEIIWENPASENYDDEQDATYLVRIRPKGYLRHTEWEILQSTGTPEDAQSRAEKYAKEHPEVPVRVERHVL